MAIHPFFTGTLRSSGARIVGSVCVYKHAAPLEPDQDNNTTPHNNAVSYFNSNRSLLQFQPILTSIPTCPYFNSNLSLLQFEPVL
jgi:hypothetical protein